MMFWLEPRRTKYVPMIEATMQTAQISSGSSSIVSRSAPVKKIAASSMVATTVTA